MTKETKILVDKKGIKIVKKENEYIVDFQLENNSFSLNKIINLSFIKIITSLNSDFIDNVSFLELNDDKATLFISLKHFYCDLGFPQFYMFVKIKTEYNKDESLHFLIETVEGEEPPSDILPNHENVELLNISNAQINCFFRTPHVCDIEQRVIIDKEKYDIPNFIEKSLTVILFKMFLNVKEFIEKSHI